MPSPRTPLGTATVLRADARALPMADDSVDLIVTSPPYFALRSYTDAGEHYDGQLGSEPTPDDFLDALLEATAECVRVLKPSGSIWVNLGDKYAADRRGPDGSASKLTNGAQHRVERDQNRTAAPQYGVRRKSLLGLPWRYAIRCIDELGLILREEIIWSKPNGLPESVTDRARRSHEQWFHFTREPRYFAAVDELREPHAPVSIRRAAPHRANPGRRGADIYGGQNGQTLDLAQMNHPLGRLPGSVWSIATEPLKVPDELEVDHYAAFPTEWPRRIILGWSPSGICTACGEGRRPLRDDHYVKLWNHTANKPAANPDNNHESFSAKGRGYVVREITGYACVCPEPTAPTTPAVVLDPFGGTGTTALVAKALGRHGITVDLSADYGRLARWRTNDRDQLAKVLDIAKTTPAHPDQASLFDMDGATA